MTLSPLHGLLLATLLAHTAPPAEPATAGEPAQAPAREPATAGELAPVPSPGPAPARELAPVPSPGRATAGELAPVPSPEPATADELASVPSPGPAPARELAPLPSPGPATAGELAPPSPPEPATAGELAPPSPPEPAPAGELAPVPTPEPATAGEPALTTGAEPVSEDMSVTSDGPVAISTRVTPDPSQVGDLLQLEVTVAYPAGYTVNVPLGLKLDPMHLVSVDESEPESTGQGLRKLFTFTLQHFQVGEARTPTFPITYVAPDGDVQTATVPAHSFAVTALLANEADPVRQGEDPPVSLEYPNHRAETAIYYTAGALIAGFVSALLWLRWRRRPRPVVLPPPEPADRVAMRALDRLQDADYAGRGEFQLHYLMLTEILKGYLEGRFGIDALERTTDELRAALLRSEAEIAPLRPVDVIRFLQQCDLVKFARFAPPPSEANSAIEQARGMVRATTKAEPSGPADPKAPKDMSKSPGPSDQVPPADPKGQDPEDMSRQSGASDQAPPAGGPTGPAPGREEGQS